MYIHIYVIKYRRRWTARYHQCITTFRTWTWNALEIFSQTTEKKRKREKRFKKKKKNSDVRKRNWREKICTGSTWKRRRVLVRRRLLECTYVIWLEPKATLNEMNAFTCLLHFPRHIPALLFRRKDGCLGDWPFWISIYQRLFFLFFSCNYILLVIFASIIYIFYSIIYF